MIKAVKHIIVVLKATAYYLYTYLFKKDKNIWVFGAWKGSSYNDNSKYLFEYVLNNCPDIKAYWVTKNKNVFEKLQSENKPVVFFPSKEAKKIIRTAKYHFLTEGPKDIGHYPVGGATVIMLWHGCGPKMANWWKGFGRFKKAIINIESGNRNKYYWTSSSPFCVESFSCCLGLKKDRIFNGGFPRCDAAFNRKPDSYVNELRKEYEKIIVYMPTHRNWGEDFNSGFFEKGLSFFDKWLVSKNYFCLFKIHPNEIRLINNLSLNLKNIHVVKESEIEFSDPYEYVFDFDCLISDYSSVLYDYLCVNKPIILFPYDLKHFSEKDGGISDVYFSHQVGPIVYDWESLVIETEKLLYNDEWKEKRTDNHSFLNKENDGTSCRKVVNFVRKLNCANSTIESIKGEKTS